MDCNIDNLSIGIQIKKLVLASQTSFRFQLVRMGPLINIAPLVFDLLGMRNLFGWRQKGGILLYNCRNINSCIQIMKHQNVQYKSIHVQVCNSH